jgi:hypothetical protein
VDDERPQIRLHGFAASPSGHIDNLPRDAQSCFYWRVLPPDLTMRNNGQPPVSATPQ